jgi:hypothetical protein
LPTQVYETVDILVGETDVTLRPLPVKHLKKVLQQFGKYTKEVQKAVESDTANEFDPDGIKFIDNLVACTKLSLDGLGVSLDGEVDEIVDMDTMYTILEVCADINLRDTTKKLQEEAMSLVTGPLGQN